MDLTREGLIYVGLDSLGKADLTRVLSSAVLQRMSVYASELTTKGTGKGIKRFLIVDEANWVNRTILLNLLSRARSAGIAVIVATQGPSDWEVRGAADTPGFSSLAQNCNVSIFMRQGEHENSEIAAKHLGMEMRQQVSQSYRAGEAISSGSIRDERDYRVPPEVIRNLQAGELYVNIASPNSRLEFIKVVQRDPTLSAQRRNSR